MNSIYELEFEAVENEYVVDGSCESTEDVMSRVGLEIDNLTDGDYYILIIDSDTYEKYIR